MKYLLNIVDFLSGEWMLSRRSNSGSVIFLRSALVSVLAFAVALGLKSAVDPSTNSDFSFHQLRIEVRDHIGWLGAILAVVYAGFYARYSSQWSYLAGLYNQLMATASTLSEEQRNGRTFLNWQVAFIEDCYFLLLDRKEIFSVVIKQTLEKPLALQCFVDSSPERVVNDVLERNGISRPLPNIIQADPSPIPH
jgi:hypothetical protein